MPTVTLTDKNFEEQVSKGGVMIVDFWAPWCGPCKVFAPIFEQAAERHPDVTFAKVNTDEETDLAGSFQVTSIPTVMVFRDEVLVFEQPGLLRGEALDELIAQVKELDMAEVRKEIAEHEKMHAAEGDACCDHDHDEAHDHAGHEQKT
jgi:thioredoxin 1